MLYEVITSQIRLSSSYSLVSVSYSSTHSFLYASAPDAPHQNHPPLASCRGLVITSYSIHYTKLYDTNKSEKFSSVGFLTNIFCGYWKISSNGFNALLTIRISGSAIQIPQNIIKTYRMVFPARERFRRFALRIRRRFFLITSSAVISVPHPS